MRRDRVQGNDMKRNARWILLPAVAMVAACAALPQKRERISIESDPPGARVFVSGKELGATPLPVVVDEVFPMHWTTRIDPSEEGFAHYRRLELLEIKKDGCEPYSRHMTGAALENDIKVTLKCDPNYSPPAAAPGAETVEQRLQNLEQLKSKGLISDDEYRLQRQRILNQL